MALVEIERRKAQPITFALKVAKVDAEARTVKGIASQEIVDAHDQIVDYATLKACLPGYKNNIREMHQPKAVGKAVSIECDDASQAVIVESYISKGAQDTWEKCLDGTLSAYSIGGVGDIVVGKNADGKTETRIFLSALNEISLVDAPACPTASFEVVKLVDGVPTDVRPADPEPADTANVTKAAIRKHMWEGYDIERALSVLILLQALIESEMSDLVYGESDGSDPENAAQLDALRIAAQIVFDFAVSEFESQFTALEARQAAIGKLADSASQAFLAAFTKAAARPKHIDKALAQKVHDNCLHLGAACGAPMEKTITPVPDSAPLPAVEKTAATEAVTTPAPVVKTEPIPGETPDLAAIVKAAIEQANAPLVTELKELKATSTATIAKLEERLTKVEDSPAPGGPVKTGAAVVVDKTLAGDAAAQNPAADAARLVALANEMAPHMTAEQRDAAVTKVIAAQQVIGRVDLRS